MAQRGNRPIDPQDTKGGVRGTHGLGDAPRESGTHPVATRGGTASPTGGSRKGGTLSPSRVGGAVHERPTQEQAAPAKPEHDEATGEEHGFEMSSAIEELESTEERARRREREAAAALEEIDEEAAATAAEAEDEEVLGDPRSDEEERRERGLATEKTPGPGPKDRDAGTARVQHLEDHRLR